MPRSQCSSYAGAALPMYPSGFPVSRMRNEQTISQQPSHEPHHALVDSPSVCIGSEPIWSAAKSILGYFGAWGWERVGDDGKVIAESREVFEQYQDCVEDARQYLGIRDSRW